MPKFGSDSNISNYYEISNGRVKNYDFGSGARVKRRHSITMYYIVGEQSHANHVQSLNGIVFVF